MYQCGESWRERKARTSVRVMSKLGGTDSKYSLKGDPEDKSTCQNIDIKDDVKIFA